MTDRIEALDARLRDVERNAALQGQTLDILREDAYKHADRETVEKLQAVQTTHGEDIAVLKAMRDQQPDRNPLNPIDWMRTGWEMVTTTERVGRAVAGLLGLLLVLGLGFVGYQAFRDGGYVDRWLTATEKNAEANEDGAGALEEIADEPDALP